MRGLLSRSPEMQEGQNRDAKSTALELLPKSHTVHWVARRKALVVQAVRRGWLSLDDACTRYKLSFEEFLEWQRAFSSGGVNGLSMANLHIAKTDPGRGLHPRSN